MSTRAKVREKVLADGGTFEEGYTGWASDTYWVEVTLSDSETVWACEATEYDSLWTLRVEQEDSETRAQMWSYVWDKVRFPVVRRDSFSQAV